MRKMHKKILEILFIIEEMHIERRKKRERMLTDTAKNAYPKSKLKNSKKESL